VQLSDPLHDPVSVGSTSTYWKAQKRTTRSGGGNPLPSNPDRGVGSLGHNTCPILWSVEDAIRLTPMVTKAFAGFGPEGKGREAAGGRI
jgi:hypothetical protein